MLELTEFSLNASTTTGNFAFSLPLGTKSALIAAANAAITSDRQKNIVGNLKRQCLQNRDRMIFGENITSAVG